MWLIVLEVLSPSPGDSAPSGGTWGSQPAAPASAAPDAGALVVLAVGALSVSPLPLP